MWLLREVLMCKNIFVLMVICDSLFRDQECIRNMISLRDSFQIQMKGRQKASH